MVAFKSCNSLLYLVAVAISLASCDGTLTHRGSREGVTRTTSLDGSHSEERECRAVCNQLNPDGRCGEWLEPASDKCIQKLDK